MGEVRQKIRYTEDDFEYLNERLKTIELEMTNMTQKIIILEMKIKQLTREQPK